MKRVLLVCVALLLVPVLGWAAPADTPETRVAAAKEYLKVVSAQNLVNDMVSEILKKVPEDQRPDFEKTLRTAIEPDFIESITLEAMPKHFTTGEIKALTKFYASPEGASIMKKFGAYLTDIMPAVQSKIATALQKQ